MAARSIAIALSIFMLMLAQTSLALAHAALTASDPIDGAVLAAAPPRLSLSFSEPVSPLALRIVRPDGETIMLERHRDRDRTIDIETPEGLAEGTHVLTWRVVSADGHPVAGSAVFSIGAPGPVPRVAELHDMKVRAGLWTTRLAIYLGLFAGMGGAFALAWLLPRSRSGETVVAAALGTGFVGAALSPGLQGLDALGATFPHYLDPLMWSTGLQTSFGRTVIAMIAATALAALSLLPKSLLLARLLSTAGLTTGAAALAMSGHAGAAEPQWLMRPAVFMHAAAIAAWAGALAPLGLALRAGAADAAPALRRFSAFIPAAILLLVLAGAVLTVVQVERPSALLDTDYGRLLAIKLALLAALFALAAFNRWTLTAPAASGDGLARRRFVRSVAAETLIVLAILAVAAGWRFTPPPRALAIAAAQPASIHIHTLEAMADVTVAPGRAGPVSVSAVIMTGDFGPLDASGVTFVLSNPDAGIEPAAYAAERPGDGTWRADGVALRAPGVWTVRIDITVSDGESASIAGEVAIRP